MTLRTRGLASALVERSPSSTQRVVRKWLTGLHASAAARGAAVHAVSRQLARAAGHDWGFFTLYLPSVEHPLYARPGTTDLAAFHGIFGRRQLSIDLGFTPRVIVDLGANVGYASVDLALRYPGASVIAVEPEPSNVEVLRRNVAGFGIVVVEAAVWPREAVLDLQEAEIGHAGFRVREGSRPQRGVNAVTIPALLKQNRLNVIDLLKIDIEGSELELLSEETEWLQRVRAICIEFHDSFRPGCVSVGEAALAAAGFRFLKRIGGTYYYVRELTAGAAEEESLQDSERAVSAQ